jgi:hypothetical protein
MYRGDHPVFVELAEVPHLQAFDRERAVPIGDQKGGRTARIKIAASRAHGRDRHAGLAGTFAALIERGAAQQDCEADLRKTEPAAGGGTVDRGRVTV